MPPEDAKTAEYKSSTPAGQGAAAAVAASVQSATPAQVPGSSHSGAESAQTLARRQSEGAAAPLIPDTCNVGIALRIAGVVHGVALAVSLSQASSPAAWLGSIGALLIVLEPVLLLSLATLCVARRVVNGMARPWQWATACGLPAVIMLVLALPALSWLEPEATAAQAAWWIATRVLLTAAAALALTEVFRLRARAYSPSFSEARLQALQARIRPHFLFNSLNAVLGLMRSDPRRAESTLENLADLFRVFMRDARDLVALDDEVITCKEYLAIEQLRLGERLRVEWHLEDMPGDALLPSLLLQPLLENAVHHGIEPSSDTGVIQISASRLGERVRVEILNPVLTERPVRPGNQMALSNVRERLMLLYDIEAELKTGVQGDTYRVEIEFPYRKERRKRDVRRHFDLDR
ncbi:MAG: inner membrane protein ypdA [Pseudomonadota bacterium]